MVPNTPCQLLSRQYRFVSVHFNLPRVTMCSSGSQRMAIAA
jgi:hypothetical protein